MLKIHFLNVGHGDCTIIEHPSGRLTMVDINNGDELDDTSYAEILGNRKRERTLAELMSGTPMNGPRSGFVGSLMGLGAAVRTREEELAEAGYTIELTNPVEYFLKNFPSRSIFRYIQTHPDLDHMRGLVALREHKIDILNFWDTDHKKTITEFKSTWDRKEWTEYQRLRGSNSEPKVLRNYQGENGSFWNLDASGGSDHDGIEILSPTRDITRDANEQDDSNNLSYVIRIHYAGKQVILGGDAEVDVWESLTQQYGRQIKCDVLKASHHGRDSGYHAEAVKAMCPTYTIVSVGKKPETDASNKYRQFSPRVWSTRFYGNLTLTISPQGEMQWIAQYV